MKNRSLALVTFARRSLPMPSEPTIHAPGGKIAWIEKDAQTRLNLQYPTPWARRMHTGILGIFHVEPISAYVGSYIEMGMIHAWDGTMAVHRPLRKIRSGIMDDSEG